MRPFSASVLLLYILHPLHLHLELHYHSHLFRHIRHHIILLSAHHCETLITSFIASPDHHHPSIRAHHLPCVDDSSASHNTIITLLSRVTYVPSTSTIIPTIVIKRKNVPGLLSQLRSPGIQWQLLLSVMQTSRPRESQRTIQPYCSKPHFAVRTTGTVFVDIIPSRQRLRLYHHIRLQVRGLDTNIYTAYRWPGAQPAVIVLHAYIAEGHPTGLARDGALSDTIVITEFPGFKHEWVEPERYLGASTTGIAGVLQCFRPGQGIETQTVHPVAAKRQISHCSCPSPAIVTENELSVRRDSIGPGAATVSDRSDVSTTRHWGGISPHCVSLKSICLSSGLKTYEREFHWDGTC